MLTWIVPRTCETATIRMQIRKTIDIEEVILKVFSNARDKTVERQTPDEPEMILYIWI